MDLLVIIFSIRSACGGTFACKKKTENQLNLTRPSAHEQFSHQRWWDVFFCPHQNIWPSPQRNQFKDPSLRVVCSNTHTHTHTDSLTHIFWRHMVRKLWWSWGKNNSTVSQWPGSHFEIIFSNFHHHGSQQ